MRKIITIARATFLEAINNRLFILSLAIIMALFLLAEFAGELAIIEGAGIKGSFYSYTLRLFMVLITTIFVISSLIREFDDKAFEMILSLPIKRSTYYLGKAFGFSLLSAVLVAVISLPLFLYAGYAQVLLWAFSLWCESILLIAVSLFCLFTLNNITMALIFVFGFYLLGRVADYLVLIAGSPILESTGISHRIFAALIEFIALILPDLHLYAKSSWLIYGDGTWMDMGVVAGQTVIYATLLSCAALFDLYRKSL